MCDSQEHRCPCQDFYFIYKTPVSPQFVMLTLVSWTYFLSRKLAYAKPNLIVDVKQNRCLKDILRLDWVQDFAATLPNPGQLICKVGIIYN